MSKLILASASPRRRELLGLFGIGFEVEAADIDERIDPGETPAGYVERVAAEKAGAVASRRPGCFVLGSDTAVAVDHNCLGKPVGGEQARHMLGQLSGREHEVFSSVALILPDGSLLSRASETRVKFAPLPESWIEDYIRSGEPFDKAGAYGIQGSAGIWVSRLDGSYSGVVGLPLFETGQLLRQAGLF